MTGNDAQQTVNVVASDLKVDSSIITALVNQITVDIEQNAAKFATRNLGVDGKKLFEYVSENYPPNMKGHFMLRFCHDMSVFHDMKNRKRYAQ